MSRQGRTSTSAVPPAWGIRTSLEAAVADEQSSTREMQAKLNRQLKELDKKERRLIDLLADDGDCPGFD
ncbi:hypothetical protein [Nocardia nova]|uniref:hypothetical protein n=1 Tax=Nocardia nova TaxID=37330 RepID=UPI0011B0C483|nr:hypothetical protein [Nocardia nova]